MPAKGKRYKFNLKKGILYLPEGNSYVGEWKDGNMNGKGIWHICLNTIGIINFVNGNRYEGELKDGVMNGKGKSLFL